jgi:hypothetical protein
MTNTYVQKLMARARLDDFLRVAVMARLATDAGRADEPLAGSLVDGSVTLRPCRPEDRAPLARLAALDSGRTLAGPVLLAEVGGEVRAALSLKDGVVLADPFQSTAALGELLRAYSRQPALRHAAAISGEC